MEWNINDVTEQASLNALAMVLQWKEAAEKRLFRGGGKKPTKHTPKSFSRTDIQNNKKRFLAQLKLAIKKHPEFNTPQWIQYFTTIADVETGGTFNENATSKTSSAKGYFQILKDNRKTENQFEDMFALTKQNQKVLLAGLGKEGITKIMQIYTVPEIMALSHFQGADGAMEIFRGGKGVRDANGVSPDKYLNIFRGKIGNKQPVASIEGQTKTIINPNLPLYPELTNITLASVVRLSTMETPLTALLIALEYNGTTPLTPIPTPMTTEGLEIPEVNVISNIAGKKLLDKAISQTLGLLTSVPQTIDPEVAFDPKAFIDNANLEIISEKQQDLLNILLQDAINSNVSNSAFRYALADDTQEKARKQALEIEMLLLLNLAALGGPLFNSRTPIESFQGKKTPLPEVRYAHGGNLFNKSISTNVLSDNTFNLFDDGGKSAIVNQYKELDLNVLTESKNYVNSELYKQRAKASLLPTYPDIIIDGKNYTEIFLEGLGKEHLWELDYDKIHGEGAFLRELERQRNLQEQNATYGEQEKEAVNNIQIEYPGETLEGMAYYKPSTGNVYMPTSNIDVDFYSDEVGDRRAVLQHEIDHAKYNKENAIQLNEEAIKHLMNYNKKDSKFGIYGYKGHDDLETERLAEIGEVRRILKNEGIWDFTNPNTTLDMEKLLLFYDKYPKHRIVNMYNTPERMSSLLWLLNNLAYNPIEQLKDVNYAALGGNLFLLGGDNTEGGIIRPPHNKVYNNYEDAIDNNMGPIMTRIRKGLRYIKDNISDSVPAGISNCTLTATQWIDPTNPIMNAKTIVSNPDSVEYSKINADLAVPGDLLIAKVPGKDSYHTMYISGFDKEGNPLLDYSRGGTRIEENLRTNIPLEWYTTNSDGHTLNLYYRNNKFAKSVLPEVVITGKKKAEGGNLFYDGGSNLLTYNLPGIVITRPYPTEKLIKLTIEKEWPSAAGLPQYKITKDSTFTRERTGAGSIEYFNEPSITYRNGTTVLNPNQGPTLLFDPNTNTVEDIKLDLLHHYKEYDKEYQKLLLDYTNALVGNRHTASDLFWNSELGEQYRNKYGKDIEKHWDEWDLIVEENINNDQYLTQAIDGSLRSLMASDALRLKSNYDTKKGAESSWLKDKYARRAYNNIVKYLKTPKK